MPQTPAAGSRPIALLFATSGHSGVDRVVANLLPEFGDTGHRFDLLTIRAHGPELARLPANVTHRVLRARHRNTALLPLVFYLRRERPAALLTASHRLNRAALIARSLAGVPLRVVIRMGMSLTGMAEAMGPRRSARLFRSMRRWYPLADAVVVPSAGVGEDLLRHAEVREERLHVIPNPIVGERLYAAAAEPLDHPWFSEGGPPVVLAAGSLEARKDFATLLRAFARLRTERRARLVILGRGRQRERLEALATELGVAADVEFPGFCANPYAWMARAAVFVLSSRREGSGAVLVEALACGTPAVATDCPTGPADILQHGRVGPVVPVGDDEALAAAIGRMLIAPLSPETLREATAPFEARVSARRYLDAMGCSDEVGA